ncbi:MAG TPA: DNA-directed RNA polymerase subunit alpha C-terminal domain-containing protein, partial [Polyangiaceae bacterium]|nr:DNA-directed RNA polymerase subunit alpha C-terminal domain-containing protein [Polyangiaceae bacterium]
MQQIFLDGAEFRRALETAVREAESVFVGARIAGDEHEGAWATLAAHGEKVRACLRGNAETTGTGALAALPTVQLAAADTDERLQNDVVVCESAAGCRAFVGYGALSAREDAGCLVVGLRVEPTSPQMEALRRLVQLWEASPTTPDGTAPAGAAGSAALAPLAHLPHARRLERVLEPEVRRGWLEALEREVVQEASPEMVHLGDDAIEARVQRLADLGWWVGVERSEQRVRFLLGPLGAPEDALRADVELSVPLDAADHHRYAGLLARDATTGAGVLAHRGVLRARPRSINEQFWKNTRCQKLEVWDPEAEEELRVALVTALDLHHPARDLVAFALEVQRLRQMFEQRLGEERDDPPSTTDFSELDADEQVNLVWDALIGSGALELEDAVRTAGRALRDRGLVSFQRLHRNGTLFAAIEDAIQRGARAGSFDRPRRNHVRAILPEPDDFPREYFRDCLLNVLPPEPIDRETAMREAADYAVDYYGLRHQRLRRGGRVERGIKSAINSAIRQGFVRRIGAVYIQLLNPNEQAPEAESASAATPEPQAVAPVTEQAASAEQAATPDRTASPEPTTTSTGAGAPSPEPEARATTTTSPAETPLLERPLSALELPTRTLNWAEQNGVRTVRDLVAVHPDVFATQRNIGRGSLRETRAALEAAFGKEWEEVWHALPAPKQGPSDIEAEGAGIETHEAAVGASDGPVTWASALATIPEKLRSAPLDEVELPTRMRNYCEQHQLTTLEQLLSVPAHQLLEAKNIGRTSLRTTLAALRDYVERVERAPEDASFLESWKRRLHALEPLLRLIVTRRAGVTGEPEKLESLGEMLGVTRERVRQLEVDALESLGRQQRWLSGIHARLSTAFAGARSVPLELLEEDPWWHGIGQHRATLKYVCEKLLADRYHLVTIHEKVCLALFRQDALDAARSALFAQVRDLEFPARLEAIHELIAAATAELGGPVRELLTEELEEDFVFDEADRHRVLGLGRNRNQEILAFLRAAPEPVRVGEIEERFGRGSLPADVLYFSRGVVGLKQHFPDFEQWQERLVPRCVDLMQEGPPGRQWLVPELLEALAETVELPDWLKHWRLASLLRTSGKVRYLGRLRVALLDSEASTERIHVADRLHDVLNEAGRPLPLEEIRTLATRATDIADQTLRATLLYSPFVKLDADLYGLLERDVPGGADAIALAADAVAAHLEQTGKGLTQYQAEMLVRQLSSVHAPWSTDLIRSVLRNEPRLHLSRGGGVGLSEWDDVRAPTRAAVLQRLLDERGELPVTELDARTTELFGKPFTPAALNLECQKLGFEVVDGLIRKPVDDSTPPPSRVLSAAVPGIPAEARQLFEELLAEPELSVDQLRRAIDAHVEAFEREFQVNEFADLALAKELAALCSSFLDRFPEWSADKRRVAQAGIRYFVNPDDYEDDFGIGGLDDDR